jgi:hypothetical protein
MEALLGIHCLATEIACAAAVVGAGWLALRGGTTTPARASISAAAGAGALVGAGALQVVGAAHTSLPHLVTFHVGGMLLAVAAASLLWPRQPHAVTTASVP